MDNYKSQIGQDKYISDNIFNNKKNGFFIELGATDGISLSNTYFFEKELGWGGICIEPNPKYKDDLIKNRDCHKSFSPVYSVGGKEVEFELINQGEYSGIKNHLNHVPINNQSSLNIEKTIIMKTETLTAILDKYNAPKYIDYLSLDTEGSELEILKGLDFNKYIIGYISVEHNYGQPNRSHIHEFLINNGYIYSRWNRFDDEYMHITLGNKFAWSNSTTDMNVIIA
jgi:FkbM family methyltransferase